MKVALMVETDGPGGAETVLLHTAEGLRARGHEVLAVGPEEGEGWLSGTLRARGIARRTFRLDRPVDPGCWRRLAAMLAEERVDVVHSHEFTMAVYGAAAAGTRGLPHVVTMHGGRHYAGRLQRRVALRWALRRSTAAVAVSAAARRDLVDTLGLRDGEVEVVPNGLPTPAGDRARGRASLGLAPDRLMALAVGNLYPVKGHAVLVEAAARLARREDLPPWTVAVAGRGQEEEALTAAIRAGGLCDRVSLLGFRRDVPDLLAACDVFVMPSLNEGHPLALIEAMLAGKPVVASRVGGIPELVDDGVDGRLVEARDPGALAGALGSLLVDESLRGALARRGRTKAVEGYGLDRMLDDYEALYVRTGRPSRAAGSRPVPA